MQFEITFTESSAQVEGLYGNLADAERALRTIAMSEPERGGGYCKTGFRLMHPNGETYEGRWDITRGEDVSIAARVGNAARRMLVIPFYVERLSEEQKAALKFWSETFPAGTR